MIFRTSSLVDMCYVFVSWRFWWCFYWWWCFQIYDFLFTPRKMVVNKPLVNSGFKYFCLCSFYWGFHDPIWLLHIFSDGLVGSTTKQFLFFSAWTCLKGQNCPGQLIGSMKVAEAKWRWPNRPTPNWRYPRRPFPPHPQKMKTTLGPPRHRGWVKAFVRDTSA